MWFLSKMCFFSPKRRIDGQIILLWMTTYGVCVWRRNWLSSGGEIQPKHYANKHVINDTPWFLQPPVPWAPFYRWQKQGHTPKVVQPASPGAEICGPPSFLLQLPSPGAVQLKAQARGSLPCCCSKELGFWAKFGRQEIHRLCGIWAGGLHNTT